MERVMVIMERATFTVAETAQYIGLGLNKTYQLVNDHVIPNIKLGRQFRIPKVALDEWLMRSASEKAS